MIRSVVTGTGAALPVRRVSNAELAAQLDTSDEWIVERTDDRNARLSRSATNRAVPSAVLSAMLPEKPSHTITSCSPRRTST